MAENVFRFYRGTCHLFYEDLFNADPLPPSPLAWICGDLHLENFGSYKADNRVVYFDLNDFDEGILAPAAWEIVRVLTSIIIAFDNLGIDKDKAIKLAQQFLRNYSATLIKGKPASIDPRTARGIVCTFLEKAALRKQKDLLKKRTNFKKHKLSLSLAHEKQFELDKPLKKDLKKLIGDWVSNSSDGPYNFKVMDCIFRLAGTGSVGVKRYLFLLRSLNVKGKYLLLDMKQAKAPSLQPYVKVQQPKWETEADRVISIQQRMQNVSPKLLGGIIFDGNSFVLQEMLPTEDNINFEFIKDQYRDIYQVIDDMAMLTASAQLRSGGRQGSANADEMIAFGQNTQWQEVLLNYAVKYARKVGKDYDSYLKAFRAGKME